MCPIKIEPPRRLKDFLIDDDSVFTTRRNSQLSGDNHEPPPAKLPRSRRRSRTAVESLQKLLRRSLHVITPAPATLPRSFSRRLLMIGFRLPEKSSKSKKGNKVKVKDILRWRSFRDLAEDSQPLDLAGERVGPAGETLPFGWDHCNCLEDKRVSLDGGDLLEGTMDALDSTQVGPKDNIGGDNEDDKEQHSPVSILDSPFRDETLEPELETSSFNQSLANMERTKQRLLQSIQWFESLAGLDDESCLEEDEEEEEEEDNDELVVKEERIRSRVHMNMGLCWVQKGVNGLRDSEECTKDMEKHMQWGSKFGEEKEDVTVELEVDLFHELMDDLLVDLFACE